MVLQKEYPFGTYGACITSNSNQICKLVLPEKQICRLFDRDRKNSICTRFRTKFLCSTCQHDHSLTQLAPNTLGAYSVFLGIFVTKQNNTFDKQSRTLKKLFEVQNLVPISIQQSIILGELPKKIQRKGHNHRI